MRAIAALATVVVGNLVGGPVFVALVSYGHIRKLDWFVAYGGAAHTTRHG